MAWCFAVRFSYSFAGHDWRISAWGLGFGCCLLFSWLASGLALRRRKSRRVPPSGPRLRRPGKEGPRRAAVYLLPYGPGRAASGGFRFDILSQRKRPAIHGRPPTGFFHSLPSPAATDPEGGTRRLFRTLRWVDGKASLAILMRNASCVA